MQPELKPSELLLIVDDDAHMVMLLRKIFENEGYRVITAQEGHSALQLFEQHSPDMVLLDVMMPRMNGYETCVEMRRRSRTRRIPILMLTALGDTEQKVDGFEAGADDYVTKPFNLHELKARIRAHLRRTSEEQSRNPLTDLPGNPAIHKKIDYLLQRPDLWAILYVDLDHFKAYNDIYGFAAGDEIIILTAQIMEESIVKRGQPVDFLGHIGGDDFILITTPERMDALADYILDTFAQQVRQHYKPEDVERGYLVAQDRHGQECQYPLTSLSIGAVTNRTRAFDSYVAVSAVAAEMKKYAKGLTGRKFAVDQRHH